MTPVFGGVLLSLFTAFCFGSYTSFNKLPRVVASNVNPVVFNLYFMVGALLVCIATTVVAIALGYTVGFTYLGLISGLLLTVSGFCSFVSIPRIGVAYTWAIAATTGCITAVVEGLFLGTQIASWWATIVALLVSMASAACIVLIKDISSHCFGSSVASDKLDISGKDVGMTSLSIGDDAELETVRESMPLTTHATGATVLQTVRSEQTKMSGSQLVVGVAFSLLAGVCLASIPLPSLFVPAYAEGLCYFFSLGVGCLLVFPFTLVALIVDGMMQSRARSEAKFEGLGHAFNESNFVNSEASMCSRGCTQCWQGVKFLVCDSNESLWKVKATLVPGVLSGIVWNAGNVAGILALQYINYIFLNALVAVSTPIAAMYGVFVWKELKEKHEIVILFVATFCLIGANVLLAYGLYGNFV